MISVAPLLADLRQQVHLLEKDLQERSKDLEAVNSRTGVPFVHELRHEHHRAVRTGFTVADYEQWRDEQVTQAAVAWVLATVFVRFCEDNRLLERPFLAGRHDLARERQEARIEEDPSRTVRDWLLCAFEAMSLSPAAAPLFDRARNPMWTVIPSHRAAENLVDFWRRTGDNGQLVHDFTDPEWNTHFLGDLYQDLSEDSRKNYALLQTPDFVVDFLLDHTLEPAVEEFGLTGGPHRTAPWEFRLIDPVCGSGGFLLGAFHRLLARWREAAPDTPDPELVARTLRGLHGVDRCPHAAAITRFRLLVTAMRETGITRLSGHTPDWPIVVETGDSLLRGRGAPAPDHPLIPRGDLPPASPDGLSDAVVQHNLLTAGSYHVVVGNPPYITVKDKQENRNYREAYQDVCSGKYALTVPFTVRFFQLALRSDNDRSGAGFVGLLIANSFMKREFGKKLVEGFLRDEVCLTHVVDTSGAYIPGHGTPTVVLVGRNTPPRQDLPIRAVLGIRGEPAQPDDPAGGLVWRSIMDQVNRPGGTSEWVSVTDLDRQELATHPWRLQDRTQAELFARMTGPSLLKHMAQVSSSANTGENDAFIASATTFDRWNAERSGRTTVLTGSEIGDWTIHGSDEAFFPSPDALSKPVDLMLVPGHARRLWPYRTVLRKRPQSPFIRARSWYDWHQVPLNTRPSPWLIVFSMVATHNRFALLKERITPLSSAPTVSLGPTSSREEHFGVLGLLNSSAVCFWLKQVSPSKGRWVHGDSPGSGEAWENTYQYPGTRLLELPVPERLPVSLSQEIDSLARQLANYRPGPAMVDRLLSGEDVDEMYSAWTRVRSRMVALQEELDWEIYRLYGLAPATDLPLAPRDAVPPIRVGERAFEIVLARHLAAGETDTRWFARHNATPVTDIPKHWPAEYRDVVRQRITAIEQNPTLKTLEQPEHKRRWMPLDWEKEVRRAVRDWLLDRCEAPELWFEEENGHSQAMPRTVAQLAELLRSDSRVLTAADLYSPGTPLSDVLLDILQSEHVPHLAALRYKASGMRKRAQWEEAWELQWQEDHLRTAGDEQAAERIAEQIPIPPKYTSADFRKPNYWALRGKLDVPRERFTSYVAPLGSLSPTSVIGWAGWDAYQRATVLVDLVERMLEFDAALPQSAVPLIAGLLEVLPWVEHPGCGIGPFRPVDDVADLRDRIDHYLGLLGMTAEQVRGWCPPAPRRGRPRKTG